MGIYRRGGVLAVLRVIKRDRITCNVADIHNLYDDGIAKLLVTYEASGCEFDPRWRKQKI